MKNSKYNFVANLIGNISCKFCNDYITVASVMASLTLNLYRKEQHTVHFCGLRTGCKCCLCIQFKQHPVTTGFDTVRKVLDSQKFASGGSTVKTLVIGFILHQSFRKLRDWVNYY